MRIEKKGDMKELEYSSVSAINSEACVRRRTQLELEDVGYDNFPSKRQATHSGLDCYSLEFSTILQLLFI